MKGAAGRWQDGILKTKVDSGPGRPTALPAGEAVDTPMQLDEGNTVFQRLQREPSWRRAM